MNRREKFPALSAASKRFSLLKIIASNFRDEKCAVSRDGRRETCDRQRVERVVKNVRDHAEGRAFDKICCEERRKEHCKVLRSSKTPPTDANIISNEIFIGHPRAKNFDAVLELRQDKIQAFVDGSRIARQVDNQRPFANSGDCSV